MSSEHRDAALFYLKRGWSVIPIAPASKKPPATFKWTEFQERLPTPQEVEAWWRTWPRAGVGIITGKVSGIIVLDVDTEKGADANFIYRTYPTPLVAQTGSGGGHFYYAYPEGKDYVPNVVGKKDGRPTGYDLRGDGGYVVAPPTLHPSGRCYDWISSGDIPAPMPLKLQQMVLPKAALNGQAQSTEPWLADALKGVGEGARDDTCARLAGYYFGRGMPEDVVLEQLLLWNERNDPPLSDEDIHKTVKSIKGTRDRHASKTTPTARQLQDTPQDLLRLMTLQQYMSNYGDVDVRWAVEGWLPAETIAMCVSPPGTYKTWTLLDLAISIATGTPFLGKAKVLEPGPVLIYQQEDFHGQMAQRIGVIMAARFQMGWDGDLDPKSFGVTLPPNPPIYLHDNRELRFDDAEVMDVLEARVAELRPKLIIVDPLYTAADMSDYMAKAIPHMMRLKYLRDRYGTSVMLAHHTGKRQKDSDREGLWGSQYLNAFLETGWQVRPHADASAIIRRHFKSAKDEPEHVLTFDINTKQMPYKYRTNIIGAAEIDVDRPMSIKAALAEHGPMSNADLARIMGVSASTMSRQMKDLLISNEVRLGRDNRYRGPEHFDVE